MARSTYIYVVMEDGLPIKGFTVKHELKTWVEKNPSLEYRFFRLRDGLRQDQSVDEIHYPEML